MHLVCVTKEACSPRIQHPKEHWGISSEGASNQTPPEISSCGSSQTFCGVFSRQVPSWLLVHVPNLQYDVASHEVGTLL